MHFHHITIFPHSLDSYINESMIARAQKSKQISITTYDPRDFVNNAAAKKGTGPSTTLRAGKRRQIDDKPYGGGPGMVMQAEPIIKAATKAKGRKRKVKTIILSPRGKQFTNEIARKWQKQYSDLILISGHYEGVDARVKKALNAEEVSIGPFVLTGGELGAGVIIDAVSRQVPGVLGHHESLEETRDASGELYTRPEVINHKGKKYTVPKVLLSGDHKKIDEWRKAKK